MSGGVVFFLPPGPILRDTTVRIADVVAAPLINNEINDRREREGRVIREPPMTRDDNRTISDNSRIISPNIRLSAELISRC